MSADIPLRNDHTIFILGAGFSVERGYPLIHGFLNRMRDAAVWYESKGRERETSAIHEVLKFRLEAASAAYRVPIDLENIEELFSLASAANLKIAKDVKLSIAATLEYCRAKDSEPLAIVMNGERSSSALLNAKSLAKTVDNAVSTIPLYDVLALRYLNVLRPMNSTVISFNYDDLVERSVVNLGGSFHYGLSAKHESEINPVHYNNNGLAILKLHGSLNWAYLGAQGKKFTVFRDAESVLLAGLIPQIVPPTWNKTVAERLAEVWASAINRLETASRLVVIGFSMPRTDMHFKYLLAAGLQRNFSLREITFVDPSELVQERAREVLASREIDGGRVHFDKRPARELVATIINNRFGKFKAL